MTDGGEQDVAGRSERVTDGAAILTGVGGIGLVSEKTVRGSSGFRDSAQRDRAAKICDDEVAGKSKRAKLVARPPEYTPRR